MERQLVVGQTVHNDVVSLLKTNLQPNREICQSFLKSGMRSMLHAFCTTKLTPDQLLLGKVWSPMDDVLALCLPMKFEKQSVDRLRFYPVVRKQRVEPGVSSYSRDIEGDLLSLFIVSPLNKFPMEADRIFEFTIAKLRMMGGIGAVVDVIQKKTVDLATAVSTENFRLDKAPHWYEVGPHADDSWDDNMRSFALTSFSVSEEATNLLNLSIEQADLSTQFLLMWLALECEVGKGPRAKQYFQNKKVGKRILQLFARLGTVRGDFAHNGKRVESPIAVQMLFLVFRLACINEPEQFELAKHHLNELAETVDF